jgi:hypothetical protein
MKLKEIVSVGVVPKIANMSEEGNTSVTCWHYLIVLDISCWKSLFKPVCISVEQVS